MVKRNLKIMKKIKFPFWGQRNKELKIDLSDKKEQEQEQFYDTFKPNSDTEIIEHFIKSEKEAVEYNFQGQMFPLYHYEIKRILRSSMNAIEQSQCIEAFYYSLRLNNIYYGCHKKNYSHFKSAFSRLLSDIQYNSDILYNSTMNEVFILLNGIDTSISNTEKLNDIDFADFKVIISFINKCMSYTFRESMVKKQEQFTKFSENATLMNLIRKNTFPFVCSSYYNDSEILFAIYLLLYFYDKPAFEQLRQQVEQLSTTEKPRQDFNSAIQNYFIPYGEN